MNEPYVDARRDPRNAAQPDHPPVEIGMRVRSSDYGNGSIVAILGIGIQIRWDNPLTGTETHMLVHDFSYVARLERI